MYGILCRVRSRSTWQRSRLKALLTVIFFLSIIRNSRKVTSGSRRTAHRSAGDGTVEEDADCANGGGVSMEDRNALTVRVEVSGLYGMT